MRIVRHRAAGMRYEIRPLGAWLGPITADRPAGRFRAPWADTLTLLSRETEQLDARLVVVQVDADPGGIRRDGMLRARARVGFPGVRVSFQSQHGPLTYATDAYSDWQANVRAIALSLQALRAVDRYGVSRRGEQYTGWQALPSKPAEPNLTVDKAAAWLASHIDKVNAADVIRDPAIRDRAFRAAAKAHHPDTGGRADLFRLTTQARDLLSRPP